MSNTNSSTNSTQFSNQNINNSHLSPNFKLANLTNEENKQVEILLFLDSLTSAITGFHLGELGDKMEEVSQKCLQIFLDYVNDFLSEKYGTKEAMRIRAANKFDDSTVFDKFAGLGDKFSEAWDSFVEFLKKENEKSKISSYNPNLETQNAI